MARAEPVLHFLAVESAGWTFALPVSQIIRITRETQLTSRKSTKGTQAIMVEDEPLSVLDVGAWLDRKHEPTSGNLVVQLHGKQEGFAIRVARALEVFRAKQSEFRSTPPGLFSPNQELPVLGFSSWSKLTASLIRGALSANNMALNRLNALGPIQKKHDRLYAGKTLLNGDKKLVDSVRQASDFGCTIFQGNVRIATTANRAGSQQVRALGSKATEEITEAVFRRGREFKGLTHSNGKDWVIVYRPLPDSSHHVVGMVATYKEITSQLFPVFDAVKLVAAMNGPSPLVTPPT